jgi:hypothetical protein
VSCSLSFSQSIFINACLLWLLTSSKLDVIKAEEEALTRVYGGLPLKGLDILRWRKYTTKVITSVHVCICTHVPIRQWNQILQLQRNWNNLIHDIHRIRLNIASYTHIVWCHNFVKGYSETFPS